MTLGVEVDQFFLLVMAMIVFFLQGGFAFLEAGAVRSKNVTNILIKNVFDSFVSGVAYWLFGYAFAYGEGNDFIGYTNFALSDIPSTDYAYFFFQYTFAATAATIVSGAVAERCEFIAYFVYSFFITGFIYPVVTHWVWGGGFLSKGIDYGGEIGVIAYQDFAGSGVLHVLGGVAAFVGAFVLGPRIGRFDKKKKIISQIRGHSVPIAALGGFILFFGFLAFNGGSLGSLQNEGDGAIISLSIVNTIISGSFAAFVALIINRIKIFGNASWSLLITINGALTGMVAVCAGCNNIYPWSACIFGCFGGVSYHIWSMMVKKLGVDDPLDAVAVHLGGGSCGVILVVFLDRDHGILFNWDKSAGLRVAWQFAGLACIISWTAALSFLLFGLLRLFKVLRVSEETELKGLDIPKHKEPAYPVEAYGHGHIERIIQILENTPAEVTQAFSEARRKSEIAEARRLGMANGSYERDLPDIGPYENPEVQAVVSKGMANGSYERDLPDIGPYENPEVQVVVSKGKANRS